jgi:hypothetical protein
MQQYIMQYRGYSVWGWQYCSRASYATLTLYCLTRKECYNRFIIIWLKFGGHWKGEKKEATVVTLTHWATSPWMVWLPLREHGNQENAILPCNTASHCPPIDQSDCNMTSSLNYANFDYPNPFLAASIALSFYSWLIIDEIMWIWTLWTMTLRTLTP